MKIHSRLFASTILCSVLAACGGGGNDDASQPEAAAVEPVLVTAEVNTGSVSAPFVRSASARSMIMGVGSQSFGAMSTSAQEAGGAMTTLGTTVASGTVVTKEISGDANVAQGRWIAGTFTSTSGAVVLTGTDNKAYHYVAFNDLATLPSAGSATCDAGKFTAPGRDSGSATANFGTTSGNASIAFGPAGAAVTGSITATAGASVGTTSLNTTLAGATSMSLTGSLLNAGSGAAVTLGKDGAGYLLVIGYKTVLANGSKYTGVGYFRCS